MQIAEQLKDTEQRRLIWRCRRGMLELDIVLKRFVYACFDQLSQNEMAAFDALLALPDNVLWQAIQAQVIDSDDAAQQHMIQQLHAISLTPDVA